MKAYLGANFRWRDYAQRVAKQLTAHGVEVVSTWHSRDESGETEAETAQRDLDDLYQADCMIVLVGDGGLTSGQGHAWEAGAATSLNYPVYIVGECGKGDTIFYELATAQFEDVQSLIDHIDAGALAA